MSGGTFINDALVPSYSAEVTSDRNLKVDASGSTPYLPFGSIHTESLTPVFQTDPVYGLNASEVNATTTLNGTVTAANNLFTCSTGTTSLAFGSLQSRKRLRYRPGQGVVGRFTALFPSTVASSITVAGLGSSESGFYFGYYNGIPNAGATSSEFGILYSTGGVRTIRTLTVATKSSSTDNIQITLNDVLFTVTGITNGASTTETAYQISRGTYVGWTAEQRGATVVFVANSAAVLGGAYSLAQSGGAAAGTFATTLAGVASTDTFIPQSSWNGADKLDGTGASGVTLNPTKGNIYQIGVQYLGFGAVSFAIEAGLAPNNADFVTVHIMQFPNALTVPHVTQPSFPFTMAAYSAGSTTNVSVSVGSFAGFIEGPIVTIGPRMSYFNTVSSSTSAYTPLFTFRNDTSYATRANQSVGNILSVSGAAKSTTGLTGFYVIRNATLSAGVPNFTAFSTTSSTYWDTAATACTFSNNNQIVWQGAIGESGEFEFAFSDTITVQPGETITLAVKSVTATATVIGSINTREDQ